MKKVILCISAFLIFFMFDAYASQADEQYEMSGADALEQYTFEAKKFDSEFSFRDTVKKFSQGGADFNPNEIIGNIFKLLFSEIYDNIAGITGIAAAVFCLGIISCAGNEKFLDVTFYVCCVTVFSIGYKAVSEVLNVGIEAMEAMKVFMAAAVPVLGGLMAGAGGVSRCILVSSSIVAITGIIEVFINVLMPICTCMLMLCGVNSLSAEFSLSELERSLQKFVIWCIGIIMVIFTGLLSIFVLAAGCADNVLGKTAKFMAGSFIPIVGGVVSDTLDTVIACSRLIKGAVGAGGVIAILYISLVPLIKISAVLILYSLTSALLAPVADKRILRLTDGFSAVLRIMLAAVVSSAIMFIVCAGMIAAM